MARLGSPMCVLLILCIFNGVTQAQQPSPLNGQGSPPNATSPVPVFVSIGLIKILNIDDLNYNFDLLADFYLTWTDKTALGEVTTNSSTCRLYCSQGRMDTCCDNIWLPGFMFQNNVGFSQDRQTQWTISFGANGSVSWLVRVQGTFKTPFDIQRFPYDQQSLQVVFIQQSSSYIAVPSALSSSVSAVRAVKDQHGVSPDQIAGWSIKGLDLNCDFVPSEFTPITTVANLGDPLPINFSSYGWGGFDPTSHNTSSGCVYEVYVRRLSSFYSWNFVMPVMLTTVGSFFCFFIDFDNIDLRFGTPVGLFLALAAINFVITGFLPSSSYLMTLQKLVVWSYLFLGLVLLQCIIVHLLTRPSASSKTKELEEQENQERILEQLGSMRRHDEQQPVTGTGGTNSGAEPVVDPDKNVEDPENNGQAPHTQAAQARWSTLTTSLVESRQRIEALRKRASTDKQFALRTQRKIDYISFLVFFSTYMILCLCILVIG